MTVVAAPKRQSPRHHLPHSSAPNRQLARPVNWIQPTTCAPEPAAPTIEGPSPQGWPPSTWRSRAPFVVASRPSMSRARRPQTPATPCKPGGQAFPAPSIARHLPPAPSPLHSLRGTGGPIGVLPASKHRPPHPILCATQERPMLPPRLHPRGPTVTASIEMPARHPLHPWSVRHQPHAGRLHQPKPQGPPAPLPQIQRLRVQSLLPMRPPFPSRPIPQPIAPGSAPVLLLPVPTRVPAIHCALCGSMFHRHCPELLPIGPTQPRFQPHPHPEHWSARSTHVALPTIGP